MFDKFICIVLLMSTKPVVYSDNVTDDCSSEYLQTLYSKLSDLENEMAAVYNKIAILESEVADVNELIRTSQLCQTQNNESTTNVCPNGFDFSGEKCFKLDVESNTWGDASIRCQLFHPNATLVVIEDADKSEAVINYIISTNRYFYQIWIAGQTKDPTDHDSGFVWKPTGDVSKPMLYTNFMPGEPNNFLNTNENCLAIYSEYKWNDTPCDSLYYALCEIN